MFISACYFVHTLLLSQPVSKLNLFLKLFNFYYYLLLSLIITDYFDSNLIYSL